MPLVAFAILATVVIVNDESRNLINVAKARNRATLSAVEAELRGATSPDADDLKVFHRDAVAVLATQPSWITVLLHAPTGRMLVNAALPFGTPLLEKPVAPKSVEAAIRTRQPAIDDLAAGPLVQDRFGIPHWC